MAAAMVRVSAGLDRSEEGMSVALDEVEKTGR
jgi:hypothetical protein